MHSKSGNITFLQHNCGRRDTVHQTILQQGFEANTTVILLQEPYLPTITEPTGTKHYITIQHPAYHSVLPAGLTGMAKIPKRPRVMAYFLKNTLDFSPLPEGDLDL